MTADLQAARARLNERLLESAQYPGRTYVAVLPDDLHLILDALSLPRPDNETMARALWPEAFDGTFGGELAPAKRQEARQLAARALALFPSPAGEPTPDLKPAADIALEGIYVASRASVHDRPAMWRRYRDEGHSIISTWIDEAGEGETEDNGELWLRIQREVTGAAFMVFYAEPCDFPLKGAYVEVGMALAAGIPVRVVTPGVELEPHTLRPLGSWAAHPLVSFYASVDDALAGPSSPPKSAEGEG